MFDSIVKPDDNKIPRDFWLLQQEAILANTSILSGLEYMAKADFVDKYKGAYYASFFALTLGFERIMKLLIACDYMLENNYNKIKEGELKAYGHDLGKLYALCVNAGQRYGFNFINECNIDKSIITFLSAFADAKLGRYYNLSDRRLEEDQDPLNKWKNILDEIFACDASEQIMHNVESKVFNNINPSLQIQDIAFDTGYVNYLYLHHKIKKANGYAIWRIIQILNPIARILSQISYKAHEIDTSSIPQRNITIPYFNEIFYFHHTDRTTALRRKRWTDLLFF